VDNLTHSLIGAAIGQTGLKKLSGLGMATLVIAANIPDVDAACFFWLEGHEHLAFRRGITHGPIAMVLLPALLTALMVGFDRWQQSRGKRPDARPAVRPLQLYALALVGCLSHPAFDWLNNYGIRLLEPFSGRWFYGDTLFIIDVWLWALLISGIVWSYVRERKGGQWTVVGRWLVTLTGLYVFANGLITGAAEASARAVWETRISPGATTEPPLIVANAVPLAFWRRDIEWRDDYVWGGGSYSLRDGAQLDVGSEPHLAADPRIEAIAARDPHVRAFLFWARMPVVRFTDTHMVLTDQRFSNPMVGDRFTVRSPLLPGDVTATP
jgi:inner membrane protein